MAMRSMGMSCPLKCAMGEVMARRRSWGASVAEEESQAVPASGQEAADRNILQGDHRKFGDGHVVAHELHYPRFLACGKRRHERLARLEHGAQAREAIARQREPDVAVEAQQRAARGALVDLRRRDLLAAPVE